MLCISCKIVKTFLGALLSITVVYSLTTDANLDLMAHLMPVDAFSIRCKDHIARPWSPTSSQQLNYIQIELK